MTSGFCDVELHHVTEICRSALMMNGVHQAGDCEDAVSAGLTGVR